MALPLIPLVAGASRIAPIALNAIRGASVASRVQMGSMISNSIASAAPQVAARSASQGLIGRALSSAKDQVIRRGPGMLFDALGGRGVPALAKKFDEREKKRIAELDKKQGRVSKENSSRESRSSQLKETPGMKRNTQAISSLEKAIERNTAEKSRERQEEASQRILQSHRDAHERANNGNNSENRLLSKIADDVEEIRQTIGKLSKPSVNSPQEEPGGIIGMIMGAIKGLLGALVTGAIAKIGGMVMKFGSFALGKMGSLGRTLWDKSRGALGTAADFVRKRSGPIIEKVKTFGGSILTAGKNGLARAATLVGLGSAAKSASGAPGLVAGAEELAKEGKTGKTLGSASKAASASPELNSPSTKTSISIEPGKEGLSKLDDLATKKGSAELGEFAAKKGATSFGELAAKNAGKMGAKKIPLLGALAGLGFAADRAWSGDWTGAGMEVASGLMGATGIGMAGSLAVDAALLKRDYDAMNAPPQAEPVFGLKDIWESTKNYGTGLLGSLKESGTSFLESTSSTLSSLKPAAGLLAGGGILASLGATAGGLFGSQETSVDGTGKTPSLGDSLSAGLFGLTGGLIGTNLSSSYTNETEITSILKKMLELMSDKTKGIYTKKADDPFEEIEEMANSLANSFPDSFKNTFEDLWRKPAGQKNVPSSSTNEEGIPFTDGGSLKMEPQIDVAPDFHQGTQKYLSAAPPPKQFDDMRTKFTQPENKNGGTQIGKDPAENAANVFNALKVAFEEKGFSPEQSAIFAEAGAAQFALESGWGKAQSGKNNFFGIKALPGEDATFKKTEEYENGRMVTKMEPFRNFDNIEEGMRGYVDFVTKHPRYTKHGAFDSKTPQEYAESMQRATFATDPLYAEKLKEIMGDRTFRRAMDIADTKPSPSQQIAAQPAGTLTPQTPAPISTTTQAGKYVNGRFIPEWNPKAFSALDEPEFAKESMAMAERLGINHDDLMAVMMLESGLDPTAVNQSSGASGLIQFMPDTIGPDGKIRTGAATEVGTSVEALRNMTATEQLPYVEKYLKMRGVKPGASRQEIYASIFRGNANRANDAEWFNESSGKAYFQNKGLDTNLDGSITPIEATQKVTAAYEKNKAIIDRKLQAGLNGELQPVFPSNATESLSPLIAQGSLVPSNNNAADTLRKSQTELALASVQTPTVIPVPIGGGGGGSGGGGSPASPGLSDPIITRTNDNAINAITMNFIGHSMAIA